MKKAQLHAAVAATLDAAAEEHAAAGEEMLGALSAYVADWAKEVDKIQDTRVARALRKAALALQQAADVF